MPSIRTTVGQHDTGLFDKADTIKTKTLGRHVDAAEAQKLTQENKGAELLIEKQGTDGAKFYDVYALEVSGKEGKSLKSVDLFNGNISFDKELAKDYRGTQAIFSPENEPGGKPGEDYVSYWNIRPEKGLTMEGIKYATFAAGVNLLSFATTGKGAVPPTMGQFYMNEHFTYDAEKAAKAKAAEPPKP